MYPTPLENKRFGVLNITQATSLALFAANNGVSLLDLQSKEGRELDALCYELAKDFCVSLRNNFVFEDAGDIARAYKALAFGGSI